MSILCIYQRPSEPDLYIETTAGITMCIAMSLTDYEPQNLETSVTNLLTWDGLQRIADFVKQKSER